jgi:hypothetical protein
MSEISTGDAGRYEIRVNGHLGNRWADRFDGLTLTSCDDGTTTIHGIVVDQSALHGLLHQVRDLGLELISVTRNQSDQPGLTASGPADSPTQNRRTT